jgi:hypothetical protein
VDIDLEFPVLFPEKSVFLNFSGYLNQAFVRESRISGNWEWANYEFEKIEGFFRNIHVLSGLIPGEYKPCRGQYGT